MALAAEMLHGRPLRIEVAAGLDETTFGTDAVAIMQAIERADGPAGVVVLMDLGSAVLSTELALDLLQDPSIRDRVTLSPAPLVEGLIVAAVAAAGGASRAEVAAEARDALMGKSGHLSTPPDGAEPDAGDVSAEEVVGVFSVENHHGLHARPAARLVNEVRALDASVQLRNLTTGGSPVPAGSLSRVATLAALRGTRSRSAPPGHRPKKRSSTCSPSPLDGSTRPSRSLPSSRPGPRRIDQRSAARLTRDRDRPATPAHRSAVDLDRSKWESRPWSGAASWSPSPPYAATSSTSESSPPAKWAGAGEHLRRAPLPTHRRRDARRGQGPHQRRDRGGLRLGGVLADVEREWASLPDPYLRERAADVHAVGDQVLRALTGEPAQRMTSQGVLVANDLTPAQTAGLDLGLVTGVVLAQGSPTSHAAILARARDIPVVVAAGAQVLGIPEGTTILLDGSSGELHVDPSPELMEEHERRAADAAEHRAQQLALAEQPAVSRDGTSIVVAANLGSVADARAALEAGADGAGLVRTEFLFLDRSAAPSVAEQRAEYDAIAEVMDSRRITLRTLDVGGDKPLSYLPMPQEANPFLGQRGIRLSLEHRDLLRDQMAAICHTARNHPTSIMIPMVSTPGEMIEARQVLMEAAGPAGLPEGLHVGTMIEVPSAALKIEAFLPYVDFVSLGTNDLTQYALAAERGNPAVAALSDALDPGVLQLIAHVCRAAQGRIDVAVCGEAASDELAIPVRVGLGRPGTERLAASRTPGQGGDPRARHRPLRHTGRRGAHPGRGRRCPQAVLAMLERDEG